MFDIFKQDIKVGDKIKLYLTTGKEPEGEVICIGDNYVLLQAGDQTQNRFFEKLIGGWDLLFQGRPALNQTSKTTEAPTVSIFNKEKLISAALAIKNKFINSDFFIAPNANIKDVRGTTCIASNDEHNKILVLNNRIYEKELQQEIEDFQIGSIIPIIASYYVKDSNNVICNSVAKPGNFSKFIDDLVHNLESEKYEIASLTLSIIFPHLPNKDREIYTLKRQLKPLFKKGNSKEVRKLKLKFPEDRVTRKNFKVVENKINSLIKEDKLDEALEAIESELSSETSDNKYKSSLLLRKAQIYSSVNNPKLSEKSYEELIDFNEKINSPANNLSHLYTELARLQALVVEKQSEALFSVRKALTLNPNNNFAQNLLKQFEGKYAKTDSRTFENDQEENLIIEAEDDSTAISRMIDIDIKEHRYTHPDILRNGNKPTAFIAKTIFEEAKKTRDVDLTERYPVYLEAAKAFSELNVGSYDLQDYLESVAFYAMLKGNSLFLEFKNAVISKSESTQKLIRLSDSACSYYIECLNLLSNIDSRLLITILANYLKLNLAVHYIIVEDSETDFSELLKGTFGKVFKNCIRSKNKEIESIAYKVIIDCGASSISAWNQLTMVKDGTAILYGDLENIRRRLEIFRLINKIEKSNLDLELLPGAFFKHTFNNRKDSVKAFFESISGIANMDIEPHRISDLTQKWKSIDDFDRYLTRTDLEVKKEIDNLIELIRPYLNRNDRERLNILIQARSIIEKQVKFIDDNTTFYGRTFFFSLLSKWKKDIDVLLEEKVTQSYPQLEILIDPPYYISTNNEVTAPLIIKNNGEATSEGFILNIHCESTVYEDSIDIPFESETEIPSGGKIETSFVIAPEILRDSKAAEITIEIIAIYQKKRLIPLSFDFTVEEEPESNLTYDDIPWRDGPIPPEHLFKGRKELIAGLSKHYLSVEKDKPFILYGLTRTGKSSILEYLQKDIEGATFHRKSKDILVLTFSWDLSEAASFKKASDFWNYILYQKTFEELEKYSIKYDFDISGLKVSENARAKDFRLILDYLNSKYVYPIFFVDEFSFIKTLIDDGTVNSAFLHSLRQFSLNDLASFVFAGTYDIKSLIRDEKYGITGQLVNAIEEQINEINEKSAEDLVSVIDDKLSFTPEAIEHIKFLSGRIPYFIQIICKYCGYYAAENKRRVIGFPEVETVVKILIGHSHPSFQSLVKTLSENTFQNNQFSPTDPKEVGVLISSIVHFNKGRTTDPRGVGFNELQQLWSEKKITAFRPKLADAINLLKEKKILIQEEDEGIPVYKFSVDLFRRWWGVQNPDIYLMLTTLAE